MKQLSSKKQPCFKLFLIISFVCFISLLNAQSGNGWTLHSTLNGVKFYYMADTCSDSPFLFLKFENTSTSVKHVNYTVIVESPGLNIPLLPQAVQLNANETKTGSCTSASNLKSDIKGITNPTLRVVLKVN